MKILKAYKKVFYSGHRYIVMRGGAGSGKSVFATQKIITRILSEEGHKFLVIRKVAATIKNSVFSLFCQIINDEGLSAEFSVNKSDFTITCKRNGNSIIFSGLDDVEKIKSIAGISGMFVEEATELTETDWNQLQLRIRGYHKNYVQFILAFNPVTEDHWLKRIFWDNTDDNAVMTLVTTYRDNPFLTDDDIKHFEDRVKKNAQYWMVYGLGQWGSIQTGNELIYAFNYVNHVESLDYDSSLPLHISFDFNVLPSCTMTIYQIVGKKIKCVDEITLPHPNNLTKNICLEFARKYKEHSSGLFIYGDASGKHEDTRSERGWNDFSIVQQQLIKFKPQTRIATKNPSVAMSCNFLNAILNGETEIDLMFDVNCKKLIDDMLYGKQDSDGGKLIEYTKDEKTGQRCEKYFHSLDTLRYFLTTAFANDFIQFQTGSKPFSGVKLGARLHSQGNGLRNSKHSY